MFARLRPHVPAFALAILLTAAWTFADRADLAALRLPDTDDAMRLQQVRDWLAGQRFDDLVQHRLADGLVMHWSRIGDLALAALIVAMRPFAGQHAAEVAAVVAWPALQFAAFVALVASIARRLAPASAGIATVMAALAYPASALFAPGRIDHHALQLLLVLVQVHALLAPPSWRAGAIAGGALAIGATIGLETLPFASVTGAILLAGWWRGGDARRLEGFGVALAAGLALLVPFAGHGGACDTVRPLLAPAIAGALGLAVVSRLGRHRLPALTVVAIVVAWLARPAAGTCLAGPYGWVDPFVARLWLAHVAEAQPLTAIPLAQAIAYAGLAIAGLVAGGWLAWRRGGGWIAVAAYQAAALALTLAQLRGVYLGAALAAVPIAALLAEARAARRLAAVLALWIGGTGIVYPIVGTAGATHEGRPMPSCTTPAALARLAVLPPGRGMAAIDAGAYAIASTPHAMIAAPYHRNNAGNAAMYRFFLSDTAAAERIARDWRVDWVALCPGDFTELAPSPRSIAGGARPAWLVPVDTNNVPALFTIRRRLPEPSHAR